MRVVASSSHCARRSPLWRHYHMETRRDTSVSPTLSWALVKQLAQQCKGVQSWKTSLELLQHNGITFLVRVAESLASKPVSNEKTNRAFVDPFENPPTQDLYLKTISPTHSIMLNKFNVVDDHLLIVTNRFENQVEPLNIHDLEAMWLTVSQLDGLAFHNCGKYSGASQPHKHMQFVRLPLCDTMPCLPFEPILRDTYDALNVTRGEPFSAPTTHLPFKHWFVIFRENDSQPVDASFLHEVYVKLFRLVTAFEARRESSSGTSIQLDHIHYNLLMTSRWMMAIPRSCEQYQNIYVNSLGFAGTLLVKSAEDLATLKRVGPLTVLQHVAYATS